MRWKNVWLIEYYILLNSSGLTVCVTWVKPFSCGCLRLIKAAPSTSQPLLLPLPSPADAPVSAQLVLAPLWAVKLRTNHTCRRKKYKVQEPTMKPRKKAHRELRLFMTPITPTPSPPDALLTHCMPLERIQEQKNIRANMAHSTTGKKTLWRTMHNTLCLPSSSCNCYLNSGWDLWVYRLPTLQTGCYTQSQVLFDITQLVWHLQLELQTIELFHGSQFPRGGKVSTGILIHWIRILLAVINNTYAYHGTSWKNYCCGPKSMGPRAQVLLYHLEDIQ